MEAARCPEGRLAKAPARAAPERTGQTRCHRGVWVRPGGRRLNTETQNNHQSEEVCSPCLSVGKKQIRESNITGHRFQR